MIFLSFFSHSFLEETVVETVTTTAPTNNELGGRGRGRGFRELWLDAYYEIEQVVRYHKVPCSKHVSTTFVTHCRYNKSVNIVVKSE